MIPNRTLYLVLFLSAVLSAQSLTPSENYIYERHYLQPVTVETPSAKQLQSVTYYDGLGRPKQTIGIKASPTGKDLVTPFEYDAFGRQPKSYLALPQSATQNGAYYPVVSQTTAAALYGDALLYAEKVFENSPLNRVLEQAAPGTPWSLASDNTVKYAYQANTLSDEVKRFTTVTTWVSGATSTVLKTVSLSTTQTTTFYGPAQLYKNKLTDEDGNVRYEFTNGSNQTLLVRRLNGLTALDTYYVYNEYDQLAFVLPPLASEAVRTLPAGGVVSQASLDLLSYQYRYDGRGRVVEKKLPGKGWDYQVYDKADRLTLYQDANSRLLNQWHFTKYDQFSRVVYTGIVPGVGRAVEQANLSARSTNHETRATTPFTQSALGVYYTNTAYPTLNSNSKLLSVQYYDTYPLGSPSQPSTIVNATQPTLTQSSTSYTVNGHTSIRSTKSLLTATYLNEAKSVTPQWSKDYYYYDRLARLIATHRFTPLGGYTKTEQLLSFSGAPNYTYTRHKRSASAPETILRERLLYDAQNRLTHTYHQVNTAPEELLSHNTYDELGRLSSKKVGGALAAPLQELNYTYNIRGWLTQLNNPSSLGADLFGFTLRYQNPLAGTGALAKYNGSISQVDWNTKSAPSALRRYSYSYDGVDRLLGAYYSKPGSTNLASQAYDEQLTYDLNGNIKTLTRYGGLDSSPAQKIDQLSYSYSGNALTKVLDASGNNQGYPLGGALIPYDANGNMKSHLDKGLSLIDYNHLNLPSKIIHGANTTTYSYLADGTKLKKTYGAKTTEYYGALQYEGPEGAPVLQFASTSEGYYDFVKNAYIYNYLDHLGNLRLSYRKNSAGALEILEESNYYPFGLKHEGYHGGSTATLSYKYKFGGKELQENGMYDFGARMYMPDIGRWGVVDPLVKNIQVGRHTLTPLIIQ